MPADLFRLFPCPAGFRPVAAALTLLAVLAWAGPCAAADLPQAGDTLPALRFQAPDQPGDGEYLGLGSNRPFALSEVDADLIMLEIVGVYCPVCFEQAPTINSLFKQLVRDAALGSKVKLLGLASGVTPMEIQAMRDSQKARYPVIGDPEFKLHEMLGSPKTPFTILARPDGTVLYTHLGAIQDRNAFLRRLATMTP